MSALRISYPGGIPVLLDLGPARAASGELRGSFAVPVGTCFHDWRHLVDPCGKEARRQARMAEDPAYAARRREQCRAANARRRARKGVAA